MKKPRKKTVSPRIPYALRDETLDHCRSIMALGEFLASCNVEHLHLQTIHQAGGVICREIEKVRAKVERRCRNATAQTD